MAPTVDNRLLATRTPASATYHNSNMLSSLIRRSVSAVASILPREEKCEVTEGANFCEKPVDSNVRTYIIVGVSFG